MHTSSAMTPEQFRAWRKSLGWKQKEAADRLGLKKRMIQYYEKGDRDGRKVDIPKSVRLACYALSVGVMDFDGRLGRKDAERAASTPGPISGPSSGPGPTAADDEATPDQPVPRSAPKVA